MYQLDILSRYFESPDISAEYQCIVILLNFVVAVLFAEPTATELVALRESPV